MTLPTTNQNFLQRTLVIGTLPHMERDKWDQPPEIPDRYQTPMGRRSALKTLVGVTAGTIAAFIGLDLYINRPKPPLPPVFETPPAIPEAQSGTVMTVEDFILAATTNDGKIDWTKFFLNDLPVTLSNATMVLTNELIPVKLRVGGLFGLPSITQFIGREVHISSVEHSQELPDIKCYIVDAPVDETPDESRKYLTEQPPGTTYTNTPIKVRVMAEYTEDKPEKDLPRVLIVEGLATVKERKPATEIP